MSHIKSMFFYISLTVLTIFVMEVLVALIHKYVMHGFGWKWHRSHHQPVKGAHFEMNDWYAVIFGILTIALFVIGGRENWIWWVALGITIYGFLYGVVHDVLVHKRLPVSWQPKHPYLQRLVNAHHMHHIFKEREGGVSFGFLYAPPLETLHDQLRQQRKDQNQPTSLQ